MCFRTINHIIKNDHLWVPCFCFGFSILLLTIGIVLAIIYQTEGVWDAAIFVGAILSLLCLGIICQGWEKNIFTNNKKKSITISYKVYPEIIITVKPDLSSSKYCVS